MNTPKRLLIYRLGTGYPIKADGTSLYSWPLTVEYSPDYRVDEFLLAEGDGRNGSGSFFPAVRVLEPQWHAHLETTQTLWLVPILERMAQREPVTSLDILELYEQIYGKPPASELWTPR